MFKNILKIIAIGSLAVLTLTACEDNEDNYKSEAVGFLVGAGYTNVHVWNNQLNDSAGYNADVNAYCGDNVVSNADNLYVFSSNQGVGLVCALQHHTFKLIAKS